eukprot:Filipodium_phascolosomae@DN6972_c0_g1_i1.p1
MNRAPKARESVGGTTKKSKSQIKAKATSKSSAKSAKELVSEAANRSKPVKPVGPPVTPSGPKLAVSHSYFPESTTKPIYQEKIPYRESYSLSNEDGFGDLDMPAGQEGSSDTIPAQKDNARECVEPRVQEVMQRSSLANKIGFSILPKDLFGLRLITNGEVDNYYLFDEAPNQRPFRVNLNNDGPPLVMNLSPAVNYGITVTSPSDASSPVETTTLLKTIINKQQTN